VSADTQREPKPGEWWEHGGEPVLVLSISGTWFHARTRSGHTYCRSNVAALSKFLGKTVDLTPPAPPAKKLRAWTYGDALVRFDALFRRSGSIVIYRLQAVRPVAVELFEFTVPFDALLESWEHSTDSGRTWQPCGVEE